MTKKIGDGAAGAATSATDKFEVSQGGATQLYATAAQLKTFMSASPTLVTPALGTPASGVLTNCTGLPIGGGGTGQTTATAALAALLGQPVLQSNMLGFKLVGADFNSTADQALVMQGTFTNYSIRLIYIVNASTSMTTAVGGFYPAASKGGTAIVANTQVYTALTGSTILFNPTLTGAVTSTKFTANPLYFSLTTPQGLAATADIYVNVVAFS